MLQIAEYFSNGINAFFWALGLIMTMAAAWIIIMLAAWLVNRIAGKPKDDDDEDE